MEIEYLSSGINRVANNLNHITINNVDHLCFGSDNNVVLLNCENGNAKSLKGHKARVSFVIGEKESSGLISGDAEGEVIYWSYEDGFKITKRFQSNHSINHVSSFKKNETVYFIICDNGGYVRVFNLEKEVQTICFNKDSILCVKAIYFKNQVLIVMGGTDKKLYLYKFGNELEKIVDLGGHEDWIRSIDHKIVNKELFIATGCQDSFIRIYKISSNQREEDNSNKIEGKLNNNSFQFYLNSYNYTINLDTFLSSHSSWIYSVKFHSLENELVLASSSADKSIIIWKPDSENGLWLNTAQLGEMGGYNLGFYSILFLNDTLYAGGYYGAVHCFKFNNDQWKTIPFYSGHFNQVKSIAFDPKLDYFVTLSLDQTTRCFSNQGTKWQEIARPQIHGYDLTQLAFVKSLQLASAADEKVLRLLEAPKSFGKLYNQFKNESIFNQEQIDARPNDANLPALGLSNKEIDQSHIILENPPSEEQLLQYTLWPEVDKLYGHGYELLSLAVSPVNKYIATTCKANTSQHAVIRIYDGNTFKELLPPLESHHLSITSLTYSDDDKYLFSSGKDRSISMFIKMQSTGNPYKLLYKLEKAHSRIVWGLSIIKNSILASVSRDGWLKLWTIQESGITLLTSLDISVSITCITSINLGSYDLLALGLESGDITLYKLKDNELDPIVVDQSDSPAKQVNQLAFKTINSQLKLAAVANDNSVRVFNINLE
ncbi:WD40 repeat-like protein [Neoconidiobolus thromboides FSU 785]|nr:WD40 repeat-like protein [Neoconidiobolus thromboides FSU 785]